MRENSISLPEGMSLKDYKEINEALRKNDGFSKEEFYLVDNIPYYGIEPDRMMITDYFPDSPSWHGKVCVVFHGEINFMTIFLKDSKNLKYSKSNDWRIYSNQEIIEEEFWK